MAELSERQTGAKSSVDEVSHGEEFHPRGTLVILLIYLLLIVALWGSMFLIMLERS
jgi:hypothetical protein